MKVMKTADAAMTAISALRDRIEVSYSDTTARRRIAVAFHPEIGKRSPADRGDGKMGKRFWQTFIAFRLLSFQRGRPRYRPHSREMGLMKHLTLATISVALSLALTGCGHDHKSGDKTSTPATSSTTSSQTTAAPAAGQIHHRRLRQGQQHRRDARPPRRSRAHRRPAGAHGLAAQPELGHLLWRHRANPARQSCRSADGLGAVLQAHRQRRPGQAHPVRPGRGAESARISGRRGRFRVHSPGSRPGSWAAPTRRTARPASSPRRRW